MKNGMFVLIGFTSFFLLILLCTNVTEQQAVNEYVYPVFNDQNDNDINDYVEESTHFSGSHFNSVEGSKSNHYSGNTGLYGHAFMDVSHDGICDFAQNGSNTWHGPGFMDLDSNGVCDYWDDDSHMHNMHTGMQFVDNNNNDINDYCEEAFHMGNGHDFIDTNGDGICDFAQDGSSSWHGPGYVDHNNNGMCDFWEEGNMGHGNMHHMMR